MLFEGQEDKPTYLKADIEGWEMPMLRGARRLLGENVRKVAITVYHVPMNDYREIGGFIRAQNPYFKIAHVGVADQLDPGRRPAPIVLHAWRKE